MDSRMRVALGIAGGVCCGISAQFAASFYGPLPELCLACMGMLGMTGVGFLGWSPHWTMRARKR